MNWIRSVELLKIIQCFCSTFRNPIQMWNRIVSLEDALKNDYFAGFTVATPAETHFELSKVIIEANKHVLVDKKGNREK